MTTAVQRPLLLKARRPGIPQAEHFEIVERPLAEPGDGRTVVRIDQLTA